MNRRPEHHPILGKIMAVLIVVAAIIWFIQYIIEITQLPGVK
jgi:hypothetical protein